MNDSNTTTFWIVLLGSVAAVAAAVADLHGQLSATAIVLLGLLAVALFLLANRSRRTSGRALALSKQLGEMAANLRSDSKTPPPRTAPEDGFDALEAAVAELVSLQKSMPGPADDLVAQVADAWKQDRDHASGPSDRRMMELTDQVFAYKHLRSLRRLDEDELDLADLIERSFASQRAEADRKHLLLQREGDALRVRANPQVLAFCIQNLVAESVANAPSLTTVTVYLAIDTAGDVRISVSDARGVPVGAQEISTHLTRRLLELQGGRLLIAGRAGVNAFTSIVLPGRRLIARIASRPAALAA